MKTRQNIRILGALALTGLLVGAGGCYERVTNARGLGASSYNVEKEEDNPGKVRQFFGDEKDTRPITPRPGSKKK